MKNKIKLEISLLRVLGLLSFMITIVSLLGKYTTYHESDSDLIFTSLLIPFCIPALIYIITCSKSIIQGGSKYLISREKKIQTKINDDKYKKTDTSFDFMVFIIKVLFIPLFVLLVGLVLVMFAETITDSDSGLLFLIILLIFVFVMIYMLITEIRKVKTEIKNDIKSHNITISKYFLKKLGSLLAFAIILPLGILFISVIFFLVHLLYSLILSIGPLWIVAFLMFVAIIILILILIQIS